jgi:predicted MFS family arabinose efflux permease
VLPSTSSAQQRTALFARYSLIGSLVGAVGALFAGFPQFVATRTNLSDSQALQSMFVLYGVVGLATIAVYRQLSPSLEQAHQARSPLRESRRIVYTLAALFSLDSFGGGFVVQSLLALLLFQRFDLSIVAAGTIFFWTGVLSAGSYLVASRLSSKIGLINTMVLTHLPSNVLLLLVPFVPTLPLALLFARSALRKWTYQHVTRT